MYLSRTKYDNSTFLESNYNDIEWIEYYSNEIEKNEDSEKVSSLYYERAKHNFRLGKYVKSNTDLEKSHGLSPNDDNLVSFAFIYEKLGNRKKSLSLLNDYQKKYPKEEFIKDYISDIKKLGNFDTVSKKNFETLKDWLIIENSFLDILKPK